MKKIPYSKTDEILRKLVSFFFSSLIFLLFFSTYLVAQRVGLIKEIISEGRSVIINGDEISAKKRALDDALYFASIQGGAKIDGYSTVNSNTALQENLLVRPSSSIKDFVIIEERKDKTHYIVKIKAYLLLSMMFNCSNRDNITLSFFRPYFNVSSRLPAYGQNFPALISSNIYENIQKLDNINLKNLTNFHFSPDKILNKPIGLDYNH